MCDSVALLDTKGCWFAKNSDPEPNEQQSEEWYPANNDENVQKTTYIEVKVALIKIDRSLHRDLYFKPYLFILPHKIQR